MDESTKKPLQTPQDESSRSENTVLPETTPLLALDDEFFSEEVLRENRPVDNPMTEAPEPDAVPAPADPMLSESLLGDPLTLLEPAGPPLAQTPPPIQPPREADATPVANVMAAASPGGTTAPEAPPARPMSAQDMAPVHATPREARIPETTRPLRYAPFVLECGSGRYLLAADRFQPLDEDEAPPFWHTLITDFHTAPGPGVILVETAPKYAHVLAQRTLQRNGELTDDLELHVLAKRRVAVQTSLAYQLVPKQHRARLDTLSERSHAGFLLHDSATLLQGLIRSWPKGQTVALLFHLPLALVLMAGHNGAILWSRRFALASDEGADFASSVDAAMHDMRQAAREQGFDLDSTVWIEGWSQHAIQPPDQSRTMNVLPVRALRFDGQTWFTALPDLLGRLDNGTAFTPLAERTLARLQPWEKWLWTGSLAASLFLGGAGWWLGGTAQRIETHRDSLRVEKTTLQGTLDELTAANQFPDQDRTVLAEAMETAQTIENARSAPPAALLWNTVARLRPRSCRLQALEINHSPRLVRLRLEGSIELGLTQAQAVYTDFLEALNRAGLRVVQQEFRLDLDTNFFSLLLEKGAEE